MAIQPRSYQFSKEDTLGGLAEFFGAATNPALLSSYSDNHAANLSFPDAFVGSNDHLRETMSNLVLQNQQVLFLCLVFLGLFF